MTRHLIDHPAFRRNSRLARFARIERLRGVKLRPQADALRRVPKSLNDGARLRRFLAMERAGF